MEVPQLALNVLASWRKQTLYAADDDFVFASYTLHGKQPRSGSVLVRDYIRPAAIRAGILIEQDGDCIQKMAKWSAGLDFTTSGGTASQRS